MNIANFFVGNIQSLKALIKYEDPRRAVLISISNIYYSLFILYLLFVLQYNRTVTHLGDYCLISWKPICATKKFRDLKRIGVLQAQQRIGNKTIP